MPTAQCRRLPTVVGGSLVPEDDFYQTAQLKDAPSMDPLYGVHRVAVGARLFAWAVKQE
jgi:hypothetical protein